jgi:serine/threonine-protein kinase
MSPDSVLRPGVVFAGRYQVVRALARGGMGAVFEVVHGETQRRRALKVILPGVLEGDEMRRRFQLEAQVAARIDSEFVVDVFDAGVDEVTGMPFLVMELLRGEDLGARLKRVGRMSPGDVVQVLHQTALALDRMRAANVVHRDLKPENLFLTEREDGPPRVKVLDLGIAKILAEGATRSQATRNIGTPLYMAPEQVESESRVTPATDIYALGMIAYTLLVGRAYFLEESYSRGNMVAFALTIQRGPLEAPEVRAARGGVTLPPSFAPWFARATANDPARRFVTAVFAILDLAAALGVAAPSTSSSIFAAVPSSAAPSAPAPGTPVVPQPAAPPSAALSAPETSASVALTTPPAVPRFSVPAVLAVTALTAIVGVVTAVAVNRLLTSAVRAPALPTADAASVAPVGPSTAPQAPVAEVARAAPDVDGKSIDGGVAPPAPSARPGPARRQTPDARVPLYSRD